MNAEPGAEKVFTAFNGWIRLPRVARYKTRDNFYFYQVNLTDVHILFMKKKKQKFCTDEANA